MKRINENRLGVQLEILCDIFSMAAAFFAAMLLFGMFAGNVFDTSYIYFGIAAAAITLLILGMLDAYRYVGAYLVKKKRLPAMYGVAQFICAMITFLASLIFFGLDFNGFVFGAVYFILAFALMVADNRIVLNLLVKICESQTLLILFPEGYPEKFLDKLKKKSCEFGRIDVYRIPADETEVSNEAAKLIAAADKILVASNIPEDLRYKYVLEASSREGGSAAPTIEIVSSVENLLFLGGITAHVGDTPTVAVKNGQMSFLTGFLKRAFDLISASVGLVLLSPIFLICAVMIKCDTPGPVFYKQERYTIHKKRFNVLKFRTMIQDAEKQGASLATANDARITRTGKILRACRLDELPQLINIIRGEMTIVGPRPERPVYADEYSKMVKNYDVRYLVKAGLTGYAQVYGQYNTKVSDKILFDSIYIYNFSIWLDIKLIILTVMIMFIKESTEGVDEDMASVPVSRPQNADKLEAADKK